MATLISPTTGRLLRFREYAGDSMSQREAYENDRITATRIFDVKSFGDAPARHCGWDDRWDFIRTLFGYPVLTDLMDPDNPDTVLWSYINRIDPLPYQPVRSIGGRPLLYPKEVSQVRGLGPWRWIQADNLGGGGYGAYDEARVEIKYDSRPYPIKSNVSTLRTVGARKLVDESTLQRYVEKNVTFVAQALTLPRGGAVWASDSVPVDDSNIRIVSHIEFSYTWHQVPGIPDAIRTCIGAVNDTELDGREAETMLLTACELRPYRWVTGQRLYDIRYKFRYFNPAAGQGHNHFLRYKGATVAPVYERLLAPGTPPGGVSGTEGIFKRVDMNALFRPPLVDLVRDW